MREGCNNTLNAGMNLKEFICLFEVYLTTPSVAQVIVSYYKMNTDTPRITQFQIMKFQDYAILNKQKFK